MGSRTPAGRVAAPERRSNNPEETRKDILATAIREFARDGLAGARVDEIAAKTKTSKRMIYYYFGDKEGLYLSALEEAYRMVREGESTLDLGGLGAVDAMRRLVEFTFDYHHKHEDFIRLVMIENIHQGQYLDRSNVIIRLNATAIDKIAEIYRRGAAEGHFRPGLDLVELHWLVSALCFFNVSNRSTFSRIFDRDIGAPDELARTRENAVEMVLRYLNSSAPG